jgi:branched-chain amino acid transport system substrate-binding protein
VVNDFKGRFEKKFGQIQLYAPYTYDAVSVMIAAMKKANSTDPAKYLPELAKINHNGMTGKIEFDGKGNIKAGFITLYKVQCGKLETLFVQKTADLLQALAAWKENMPLLAPCADAGAK